ncbi:nuclease-related domain-containing protein [Planobispora siamensis]|uniref:NERD domain-containing protein n=1 Tax=Planobispora siamensis TaxID=936338 RepID=A0A8J3SDR4_9ACTN|nr:nuclease-related domain-containing protein [Planobispora siamensis]GIH92786.1 hypothetical protein Psi01_34160 [Planobispora siamensis]
MNGPAVCGAPLVARRRVVRSFVRERELVPRGAVVALVFAVAAWTWNWRAGVTAAALAVLADLLYRRRVRPRDAASPGERATARILRALQRRGYVVLHDRALPGVEDKLAHLVLGPTGVYVVGSGVWHRHARVASSKGRLWIGRSPADDHVRAAASGAQAVADMLRYGHGRPVEVTPLVAVHGTRLPRGCSFMASKVMLMRAARVPGWITHRPVRFDAGEVAALGAVAERLLPPYGDRG